jgi:hypothetical protein
MKLACRMRCVEELLLLLLLLLLLALVLLLLLLLLQWMRNILLLFNVFSQNARSHVPALCAAEEMQRTRWFCAVQ